MPTTLDRTTVTHTPPVQRMLATAARRWPEASGPRDLMLHLMATGDEALRQTELEAAYADAYADWEASGEAADWDSTAGDGLESGA